MLLWGLRLALGLRGGAQHLPNRLRVKTACRQKAHLPCALFGAVGCHAEAALPHGLGALELRRAQHLHLGAHQCFIQPLVAQLLGQALHTQAGTAPVYVRLGHPRLVNEPLGLQLVEQRLMALDIQAEIRSVDAAAGLDYWVYLAPLASRQASLRQLKELQARKIDSYIITQGDLANGISLGIFPRSDSAESVMLRLRDAGYEPLLRELPRAQRSFWVRIAPESRRLADDVMPQLVMDFQDLQHQIMPCESVATGQ